MHQDRGREQILEVLTIKPLGTGEQPNSWFQQNFDRYGKFENQWESIKSRLAHVPEAMKGQLVHLPWLSVNRTSHIGLRELSFSDSKRRFKNRLNGYHQFELRQNQAINFAPGAQIPQTRFVLMNSEEGIVYPFDTGEVIATAASPENGVGQIPLLAVISTTNDLRSNPDGFVLWLNPVIKTITATQ